VWIADMKGRVYGADLPPTGTHQREYEEQLYWARTQVSEIVYRLTGSHDPIPFIPIAISPDLESPRQLLTSTQPAPCPVSQSTPGCRPPAD
jgi:hypothetical protein